MSAYYNENDPFAAAWLRELIAANLIAYGIVDERSIKDIKPDDLNEFTQCHFFAGIGGWSLALRLAEWEDDKPVWTGSCPCQPFSGAGERQGHTDERHLWPAFFGLIERRLPSVVFGEQVASEDGREWLSGVRADMEAIGYACGAADLCAPSAGAIHQRQRLYWVAMDDARGQDVSGPKHQGDGLRGLQGSSQPVHGGASLHQRIQARPNPASTLRVDGLSRPVGIVRGFGNAIVPQLAAEFIRASEEARLSIQTS